MGRSASATLNYQLTNFAIGHMNDIRQAQRLVEILCPTVTVPGSTGQYKVFDDLNSFQVYKTARAVGGGASRIEFAASDAFFNCAPQALEVTVDQKEREDAGIENEMAQQLLDQGKVKALLNSVALSHAQKIVAAVIAALPAQPGIGDWSNPDIDPIDQIDAQLDGISTDCGSTEFLTLTLSTTAWRMLRDHPKTKARCHGVQVSGITIDQLKQMLIFPVDTMVAALSYNSAALGQPKAKKQVVGANAIISYSVPAPSVYDPSAFKCFSVGQNNISAVRTYQDPSLRFDVHAVDWSEDIEQTSSIAARRLAIS